jgi:hypothetical protein
MGLEETATNTSTFEYMSADALTAELDGLKQQMKNVEAVQMSGTPLDLQKSPFYMHIDPSITSISSFGNLQAIYDEMTTDPHQPPPQPNADGTHAPPALSPTKIPLDQLRFMNWLSILEMMVEAEAYEANTKAAVDEAISAGKPYKHQPLVFQRAVEREPIREKDELRERVRALRKAE